MNATLERRIARLEGAAIDGDRPMPFGFMAIIAGETGSRRQFGLTNDFATQLGRAENVLTVDPVCFTSGEIAALLKAVDGKTRAI